MAQSCNSNLEWSKYPCDDWVNENEGDVYLRGGTHTMSAVTAALYSKNVPNTFHSSSATFGLWCHFSAQYSRRVFALSGEKPFRGSPYNLRYLRHPSSPDGCQCESVFLLAPSRASDFDVRCTTLSEKSMVLPWVDSSMEIKEYE